MRQYSKENENKLKHDHLWNHFKFHAEQRLALFKLYTIFITFFLGGMGFLLVRFPYSDIVHEVAGILVSALFFAITCIFHGLERRNVQLIGYSKEALKEFEDKNFRDENGDKNKDEYLRIFNKDKRNGIRHKGCYRAMFITGYITAGVFSLIAFLQICLACCHNIFILKA